MISAPCLLRRRLRVVLACDAADVAANAPSACAGMDRNSLTTACSVQDSAHTHARTHARTRAHTHTNKHTHKQTQTQTKHTHKRETQ